MYILGQALYSKTKAAQREPGTSFIVPCMSEGLHIFQVLFVPRIFDEVLGNNEGFHPSILELAQVPSLILSPSMSSLC